jgi:hypothetical protein
VRNLKFGRYVHLMDIEHDCVAGGRLGNGFSQRDQSILVSITRGSDAQGLRLHVRAAQDY